MRGALELLDPLPWMRDAACIEHPEVDFFPTTGEDLDPAVAICRRCLVLDECRTFAIGPPTMPVGVWGGTSATERKQIRRRARRAA